VKKKKKKKQTMMTFFWYASEEGCIYAHRVALAVPDFGGSFEKESGTLSGFKNDIDVARLCCGVC
jgi:hypothetical protein